MIQKLKHEHFDQIYNIMQASFIEDEYRSYTQQKDLLDNPFYTIYALYEKEEVKAFLSVWEFDDFAFFEHFAVNQKYRNGGIGARFLSDVIKIINKEVCLEVELPEDSLSKRRIGFYERNNFFLNEFDYMQPSLEKGKKEVPLYLMTSSSKVFKTQFNHIKDTLYKEVYKLPQYA